MTIMDAAGNHVYSGDGIEGIRFYEPKSDQAERLPHTDTPGDLPSQQGVLRQDALLDPAQPPLAETRAQSVSQGPEADLQDSVAVPSHGTNGNGASAAVRERVAEAVDRYEAFRNGPPAAVLAARETAGNGRDPATQPLQGEIQQPTQQDDLRDPLADIPTGGQSSSITGSELAVPDEPAEPKLGPLRRRNMRIDAQYDGVEKIDPDTLAPDLELTFAELVAHKLPHIIGVSPAGTAIFSDVAKFSGAYFIDHMHERQEPTLKEKKLEKGTPQRVINQGNQRVHQLIPEAANVGVNRVLQPGISADESAMRAVHAITNKLGRPDIEVYKAPHDGHMYTDEGLRLAQIIEDESGGSGKILARKDVSFVIDRPHGVGETFRTVVLVQDEEDPSLHHVLGLKPDRPQAPGDDPDPFMHLEAVALAPHTELRVKNALDRRELDSDDARISLAGTHLVTSQDVRVNLVEALGWLSNPADIGVRMQQLTPQRLALESSTALAAQRLEESDPYGGGRPV